MRMEVEVTQTVRTWNKINKHRPLFSLQVLPVFCQSPSINLNGFLHQPGSIVSGGGQRGSVTQPGPPTHQASCQVPTSVCRLCDPAWKEIFSLPVDDEGAVTWEPARAGIEGTCRPCMLISRPAHRHLLKPYYRETMSRGWGSREKSPGPQSTGRTA